MSVFTRVSRWGGADWRRLTRFGTVGVLGTLVYYVVLWLLVERLGLGVLLSTSIAFAIVTLENYFLHFHWTFASDKAHTVALPRFVLMNAVGFVLNWTIMYVGVRHSGLHYLLVQAISIATVIVWNYVLTHYWIFLRRDQAPV